MFSKVHTAGGQHGWQHVLVLVAVVFFTTSAETVAFAAMAKEPSNSWNGMSFVTSVDAGPVTHTSIEIDCAKVNISGHSTSSHCTVMLTGVLSFRTSNERLRIGYFPEASLKTTGNKPPHGPPKSSFLV